LYFGSWKGAHNRLRKWAADGTRQKVFTALLAQADAEGDLEWAVVCMSSMTTGRARSDGHRTACLSSNDPLTTGGRRCARSSANC
jgi:hypothetical protein